MGGFGWDLEDLGGLSQAYHHLVRIAAKVTGLEVPQGVGVVGPASGVGGGRSIGWSP